MKARRTIQTLAVCAGLAMGGAACGDSAEDRRLQAEQVERAQEQGRRDAEEAARIKAAEERAKEAQEEIDELKAKQRRDARRRRARERAKRNSSPSSAPAAAPSAGSTSCGNGLSVNSNTSCAFAEAVREAFQASGGSSVVEAYSPVTQRVYTMTCTRGIPSVCRGGNNAVVYIR